MKSESDWKLEKENAYVLGGSGDTGKVELMLALVMVVQSIEKWTEDSLQLLKTLVNLQKNIIPYSVNM